MDERFFADMVADCYGVEIDDSDGYIPICCGDIRVEFRPDPGNPRIYPLWGILFLQAKFNPKLSSSIALRKKFGVILKSYRNKTQAVN